MIIPLSHYNTFIMNCLRIEAVVMILLLALTFSGCDNPSNSFEDEISYSGNRDYTIREKYSSVNGKHEISTFVTNNSGMGIIIDGDYKYYSDYAIRYRPVISDNGAYAWAQQMKGRGYDILWQGKSVLHSGACLDFLTAGQSKAVCSESDTGQNMTRIYLIDMTTGECKCIAWLKNEYIEDVCRYGSDQFGIITCYFDTGGVKLYNLYRADGFEAKTEKVIDGYSGLMVFPHKRQNEREFLVDYINMSENDRFLYNALNLYNWGGQNCDAFAYGNDFRGRMSWDESERLRGLCKLYKKTGSTRIKESVTNNVNGILNARNQYAGIVLDMWNPDFLWSSKCYSINDVQVCTMIENCEIISSLLFTCNEGVVKNPTITDIAKKAYDYYNQWYKDGHYYQPYGFPASFDGIVVPWNYQNSMAEVCLGLYLETKEQKYLERCNDLLKSFSDEWIEEPDRIYWHYWPMAYYNGWNDDGRSVNTPSSSPMTDNLYEDCSHAGITVRLISRYVENVPNGVITENLMNKIESNMQYFCFTDGFARFISGDTGYSPKAWHYWISPYWAALHNPNFEKYVLQGYLKCFPQWDSQESLYANAELFNSEKPVGIIQIERKRVNADSTISSIESINLMGDEIFKYIFN